MGRRREIDWRREWAEEVAEARTARKHVPFWWSRENVINDGSYIPILSASPCDEPPAGQTRLYVVQTCRWRGDWDECACWSPEVGVALAASDDYLNARLYVSEGQRRLGESLGLIEVDVAGRLAGKVFLVKERRARHSSGRDEAGREGLIRSAFASRAQAGADAIARDMADWRRLCESRGYFMLEWTSLPPAILGDLLLDLGLPPLPTNGEGYEGYLAVCDWWKQTAPLVDGWQRECLRQAMDRFSDYRVVTVPLMG